MKRTIIWRLYRHCLKPILFLFHPETMHSAFGRIGNILASSGLTRKLTKWLFYYEHAALKQRILGIDFINPVWLAAWFDKDIMLPDIIADIGFGYEECGSITNLPYGWNPWTRLHRLKLSRGLIVNYGLKNKWVKYAKEVIEQTHCKVPLFVSIAKTNCIQTCDFQTGIDDYVESLTTLQWIHKISWFTLNISCPNAFGWEDYASPERLVSLLQAVEKLKIKQLIFVKLPVDKPWEEIKELVQVCVDYGIHWVIISNLTKHREDIEEKNSIIHLAWWISGKPTQGKSDYLIGKTYQYFGKQILIVGVGGIFSAEDAYHKIKQWASLVQLITGMVFQWPQLIWEINQWLVKLLRKDWYSNISDAIGKNF